MRPLPKGSPLCGPALKDNPSPGAKRGSTDMGANELVIKKRRRRKKEEETWWILCPFQERKKNGGPSLPPNPFFCSSMYFIFCVDMSSFPHISCLCAHSKEVPGNDDCSHSLCLLKCFFFRVNLL